MKLEVGMYVRLDTGKIGKIIYFKERDSYPYSYDRITIDSERYTRTTRNVIKASHNIIDLIEPLDLMYIDIEPNDGYGGIVVPRVAETLNELEKWKERLKRGECKLVYITTHEQIESMQYKVD